MAEGTGERFTESQLNSFKEINISVEEASQYDSRFKFEDIRHLYKNYIPPDAANSYPKEIGIYEIQKLYEKNISATAVIKKINEYNPCYSFNERIELIEAKVSPKTANQYDYRFKGIGHWIAYMANHNYKISPKKLNKYDKSFSELELFSLVSNHGVPPNKANKYLGFRSHDINRLAEAKASLKQIVRYSDFFSIEETAALIKAKVSLELAGKYKEINPGLGGEIIADLAKANISFKKAKQYDSRFGKGDLFFLAKAGCPPSKANKYEKALSGESIFYLFRANVSPELAKKYDKRFGSMGIAKFAEEKIYPKQANSYDKRFNLYDIMGLVRLKAPQKKLAGYGAQFSTEDICDFVRRGISCKKANGYSPELKGMERYHLIWSNLSQKEIDKYAPKYGPKTKDEHGETKYGDYKLSQIIDLAKEKISPELAKRYGPKFDGWDITRLTKLGIFPEEARKYDSRFSGTDIFLFARAGISPDEANKFQFKGANQNLILHYFGLKPSQLENKKNKFAKRLIERFDYSRYWSSDKYVKSVNFGGKSSLVLSLPSDGIVVKLSNNLKDEYKILRKIQNYHKGKQQNIIKIKGRSYKNRALIVENFGIDGSSDERAPTLESILRKEGILPADNALKYAAGIMNGLAEMREARVFYHTDIRPANILINRGKAIIIDFERAATKKSPENEYNEKYTRHYGGENDVISLGQVMYKMSTGEHLFSRLKSDLSNTTNSVRENREEAYKNKELFNAYMERIKKTVKDERIRTLIEACLRAKNWDYGKMNKMFGSM